MIRKATAGIFGPLPKRTTSTRLPACALTPGAADRGPEPKVHDWLADRIGRPTNLWTPILPALRDPVVFMRVFAAIEPRGQVWHRGRGRTG